jgi:hypothetical protein
MVFLFYLFIYYLISLKKKIWREKLIKIILIKKIK